MPEVARAGTRPSGSNLHAMFGGKGVSREREGERQGEWQDHTRMLNTHFVFCFQSRHSSQGRRGEEQGGDKSQVRLRG